MSVHIVPVRFYVGVFLALMVLTALTVWVAFHDIEPFNDVVAMAIAFSKTILVVLYFMHVRWSGKLTTLVVSASLLWLVILITFTLADFYTRGWLATPALN